MLSDHHAPETMRDAAVLSVTFFRCWCARDATLMVRPGPFISGCAESREVLSGITAGVSGGARAKGIELGMAHDATGPRT
jgi:hypothetical protein